jgi:hypothetical protein
MMPLSSQNTRPGFSSSLPGWSTGRRGAQIPPRILAGLSWIEGRALQHANRDSGFCAAVMCGAPDISTHSGRAPC